MFVNRLINELGVTLDSKHIRIQCDNQQTIRLVIKEIGLLRTKLRHVDIHNHWLRQEIEKGLISVEYTPTNKMIADGLTKALPIQKWDDFLDQLRLCEPDPNQSQAQQSGTTWEEIENHIQGGESSEWVTN